MKDSRRKPVSALDELSLGWPGRLGSHVSIREGYARAAQTAASIGAQAYQYFPKNPRSLTVKAFDRLDAQRCLEFCQQHALQSIAHTSYPVNLAVTDPAMRKATLASLANDLAIAEACGSIGVVVHFGKYKGDDLLVGYQTIISMLNEVLSEWKGQAKLLIENQAGDGSPMGIQLEELVQIRKLCDYPDSIGFCFDTCHAFASGCWNEHNLEDMLKKGTELDYSAHLKAIHCNDSVYGTRSFKDRHAIVGRGTIGIERMVKFLSSLWIKDIPVILETPADSQSSHKEQIQELRTWLGSS
jgi:deoxyribonuclease-4